MRIFLGLFIGMVAALGTLRTSAQQAPNGTESIEAQPVIKIDLSKLSPEVLKCNVCRMRLGLKPIPGGGTLDTAEHDAQAERQASQSNNPLDRDEATKSQSPADQAEAKPLASDKPIAPVKPNTKQFESHNLENQESLSAGTKGRLEQFSSPSDATRFSSGDQSVTPQIVGSTRLNSPTALQIELEVAKRQLTDRNATIEGFNSNQLQLESKIAELTIANKQYASSLSAQSTSLESLNTQLSQKTSDAASKISQLSQELESTKRELSTSVANQKKSADELTKANSVQISDLNTQLKTAESRAEEFKSQADALRRQRDGFERELQADKQSNKAPANDSDANSSVLQGSLEKAQRELNDAQAANKTLEAKIANLEQQIADQQKSTQEIESLRVQLEQQAAQMLSSQAAWDAERAELQKLIPKPVVPAIKPAEPSKQSAQSSKTPGDSAAPATVPQPENASQGNADVPEAPKDLEDDSPSSPFRAGPKTKSRAPRQPKADPNARREI